MRLLVCGSREWSDDKILDLVLAGFLSSHETLTIIEGGAAGADRAAGAWAERHGGLSRVDHVRFPADWKKYGKRAGFIRNQLMIDEGHPGAALAFKDHLDWSLKHGGTEDMVRRCKDHLIPFYVIGKS